MTQWPQAMLTGGVQVEELKKDDRCFVCGRMNAEGMQIPFEIDPQEHAASCQVVIPARYQGWHDVVHGGIVATLLDEACAHAARTLGPLPLTVELTVRYRKPVPVASEVAVWAKVAGRRKRLVTLQAQLEIGGELHAEAEARVYLKNDLTD